MSTWLEVESEKAIGFFAARATKILAYLIPNARLSSKNSRHFTACSKNKPGTIQKQIWPAIFSG